MSNARRGRPKKDGSEPADRVPLGFRVKPDMKRRIENAAKESGRSQSQEAELRLEKSFLLDDLIAAGLIEQGKLK